jgi:hypothetical protein
MSRPFTITLAAAGLLAGAAAAAAPTVGATLGTDSVDVAAALSGERYEVTRFERFPEAISVTALKEGSRLELALDPVSGAVIALSEYGRSGAPEIDPQSGRIRTVEEED